jgi:DNA segregation ATPase FtsK/SpoIIIE-like protein
VFEGYVEIEREKAKEDTEGQAKLFLKAKKLFKDIPKEQLKISLIQRKMQIGYGKASRIKDYLLGEN